MFEPAQVGPTVPYNYRPLAGPQGAIQAPPSPYAAPQQAPPAQPGLPPMPAMPRPGGGRPPGGGGIPGGENPFDDVLERVERDWSTAMDTGAPGGATQQPRGVTSQPRDTRAAQPTPFADHVMDGQATERFRPLAEAVGSRLGVPVSVALALVQTVSGGRPEYEAAGGQAVGLAGVPKALAPGVDLRDPTANLTTSLARLRSAHDRLGDWDRAALSVTGFGDARGEPRILGEGVDGFSWRDRFKAARRRYESAQEG